MAQVKQLRNELQTALTDNKNQKAENERLRAREGAIDQRIQTALEGERAACSRTATRCANDRSRPRGCCKTRSGLDSLSGKGGQPICRSGWAWRTATGKNFGGSQIRRPPSSGGGTRWVEPDAKPRRQERRYDRRPNFPTSFGPAQKAVGRRYGIRSPARRQPARCARPPPVYTVPSNRR